MLLTQKLGPSLDQLAAQDFTRAFRQALWRDWLSWLTGKNNLLLPFEPARQHFSFKGQHYCGIYSGAMNLPPWPLLLDAPTSNE